MNTNLALQPVLDDQLYAVSQTIRYIDAPVDEVLNWFVNEPIENFMLGTLVVPPITGTEAIDNTKWGDEGSVRKITFKDKSTALERILETDFPRSYSYQPWAYTSPVKILSDFAVAKITVSEENGKTKFVWDYDFHAKNGLSLTVLKLFVKFDWLKNLSNAMDVVTNHLETHGTSKHIHEV